MTAGAPWSVKGIDPKAREIAKDLARRSGMTLGEWLNQVILEDGPEAAPAPPPEPARRRFDALRGTSAPAARESPAAPIQRLEAEPVEEDDIAQVAHALDRLSERIAAAEHRSTLAISGVDQSVAGVLARMETAEREQVQVAARFEGAIDEVRSDQQTIVERLRELESSRSGARSAEALKALEGALTRVATHLYEGEGRAREALADVRRDVDGLADRVLRTEGSNDPGGVSALVEQVVGRIAERLEQGEARTTQALKSLEGSFVQLDQRLRVAEEKLESGEGGDGRFDRMEGAMREMTSQVQAAEARSTQVIERMGQEIVRMADSLNQKVQGVDHRSAEAIAKIGGEISRVADAVEGRMKRAETAQVDALEKLGSEIARITERLAERITNAERRSAQSMDDVGEQVSRATERLQQRQERVSSELVDRMRQSEERTARLLDEARDKIDRRLGEAQQRLVESAKPAAPVTPAAAPAPPAYDPFSAGPFSAAGMDPFGPQDFGTFAEPGFPAAPPGDPAFAAPAADYVDPGPFAPADPAPPPAFAPADIEAAEDFSPIVQSFQEEEPPQYEEEGLVPAPEKTPTTGSPSTRELIAQARAAARAASQTAEGKGRKGGVTAGAARESGPLFSGFGIGRKKAKPEGSALKTALMMSAAAAFLGLGTAGLVLENGGMVAGWSGAARKAPHPDAAATAVATADADGSAAPAAAIDATPLDPQLALALSPNPATAPSPPPAEAPALYAAAVAQIEGGDNSGLEPLRRASNLGYAPAQYYLAKLYEDGKAGLTKNLPEARRWTERAAANGEPRAMHNLGTYYYDGQGGPQNSAAAADWFKKAAELGWVDSQFNLAVMNEKGLGVRRNPAEAYKWYVIAARGGDEPSRSKAADLKKLLSPAELAAAERAAGSFRAEAPNPSVRPPGAAPAVAAAGNPVAAAQRALSKLGYYQGPTDGAASPALRLAVTAYQRDKGLTASGELTPELMQRFASAAR